MVNENIGGIDYFEFFFNRMMLEY